MLVAARKTWMKTFGKALVNFWYRYISHCDSCPVGLSLHSCLSSLLGYQHRLERKTGKNRTQMEISKLFALWDDDDDDLWLPERHISTFFFNLNIFSSCFGQKTIFSQLNIESYPITVPRWVLVTFFLFCLCRPFFFPLHLHVLLSPLMFLSVKQRRSLRLHDREIMLFCKPTNLTDDELN